MNRGRELVKDLVGAAVLVLGFHALLWWLTREVEGGGGGGPRKAPEAVRVPLTTFREGAPYVRVPPARA